MDDEEDEGDEVVALEVMEEIAAYYHGAMLVGFNEDQAFAVAMTVLAKMLDEMEIA